MKLILIPDNPVSPFGGPPRPKVAISIPGDDHTIHDIIEQLVTPALVGMSFHPQTIQDGYREARVLGARDGEEDAGRCWSDEEAPAPPPGYTLVGRIFYRPNFEWPQGDLLCCSGGDWFGTPFTDDATYWYAAHNGSDTLAELLEHVAGNRKKEVEA